MCRRVASESGMTAGGSRAKSWEFHDVGCNARLLGRPARTPAHPESHAQAEGSGPPDLRERNNPLARIPRIHSSRGCGARREQNDGRSRRIDVCIPQSFAAVVVATPFHPLRSAKTDLKRLGKRFHFLCSDRRISAKSQDQQNAVERESRIRGQPTPTATSSRLGLKIDGCSTVGWTANLAHSTIDLSLF
jgi:hypothetical protein